MSDQLAHESPEIGDAAFRMMRALARRAGDGDTEALEQLARLERDLATLTGAGVAGFRNRGHSWADVADVLGTTRQNAFQRWAAADVLPAHPPECRCGRPWPVCPRAVEGRDQAGWPS